jgi:hypothetical protein
METDDKPLMAAVLTDHARRIGKLEEGMGDIGKTIVKIEQDVSRNNQLTSEIRDDTKEIRDLAKGAKAFGKIAAWGGSALGLLIALYTLGWLPK